MENKESISVALAHHWMVTYRGGEKVLAEFRRLFPRAPIATLVSKRGDIPEWIFDGLRSGPEGTEMHDQQSVSDSSSYSGGERAAVLTSPLNRLPYAWKFYKALLPLHSWSFSNINIPKDVKFVLSSDAGMVKGLKLAEGVKHVCYCHSPPRYLWDMEREYASNSTDLSWVGRQVFSLTVPYAKRFDYVAAQRVDDFIANSKFVAARIRKFYDRESEVIYPPVAINDFSPNRSPEDFYLLVSQLTPYKRADLAVKAFTRMGKPLVVIGEGSETTALKSIAGPTVKILGKQPFSVVKDHFERCRAFLYPQIEDFGITAVEAQAAGKPVIAFGAGGALETVRNGETGLFFLEQTDSSLAEAVQIFEASGYFGSSEVSTICRRNAELYSASIFRTKISNFLQTRYPEFFRQ